MPRPPRADEAGALYHALNRGNARATIFHKDDDYAAFERILAEGLGRYEVRLLGYELMPTHWHLVLRPDVDGEMSRFLRWVTATHTMRYHAHYLIRPARGISIRAASRASRSKTTTTSSPSAGMSNATPCGPDW